MNEEYYVYAYVCYFQKQAGVKGNGRKRTVISTITGRNFANKKY